MQLLGIRYHWCAVISSAGIWLTFTLTSVLGDLAFGYPFGMLKSGRDTAMVAKNLEEGFKAIEKISQGCTDLSIEEEEMPYIELFGTLAEGDACLGWLPRHWQTIIQRFPGSGYNLSSRTVMRKKLGALATMAIARRMANFSANGRPDMLQKLLEARDDEGKPLKPEELSAEAIVLIVAGSDTIAK